jgi:hypothetical protein
MKYLFLISTLFFLRSVYGQTSYYQYFTSFKAEQVTIASYVELDSISAFVFECRPYNFPGGAGTVCVFIDTLPWNGNYFAGKRYKIVKNDKNYSCESLLSQGENKVLSEVFDQDRVFPLLNEAYFLGSYFLLNKEVEKEFPLMNADALKTRLSNDRIENRNIDPMIYRQYAQNRLREIKDSLYTANETAERRSEYIQTKVTELPFQTFCDTLLALPHTSNSEYFGVALKAAAGSRPEFFFAFVNKYPSRKGEAFAYMRGETSYYQSLKTAQGYDEVKAEFFQFETFVSQNNRNALMARRRQNTAAVLSLLAGFAIIYITRED